ncbi:MAG: hypothetical protein LBK13_04055 [Spirochaetales bacterium]|jgi:hypothetical protein|nr:hypothetical protein [Spirochaetales bacterium]
MDDKQKLISEIEGRIRTNEENLKNLYAALGEYAAKEAADGFSGGELRDILGRIKEFQSAIEATSQAGNRILKIEERLEEILKSLRRLENECGGLEKENIPAYEEFGRVCADSYDEKKLPPEARDVLESIRGLRQEESAANEKISGLKESSREKSFLSRMLGSGRAAVLGSSINFKLKNLGRLYQSLGRIVLSSLETVPPDAFLNVYRANRKQLQENAGLDEKLREEMSALEAELTSLGVEKRFQKRLKDLELQNGKNFAALEELLVSAGKDVFENHKDFRDGRAEGITADIQLCLERTAGYAEEKKRLEAALEYDRLTRKIHDLKQNIENEERAVALHRDNVEKLKAGVLEAERERAKVEHLSRDGEKRQKHGGSGKTK